MTPALFIDKDGTLVENVPYNVDPERVRFADGALPALRRIARAGFELVVVTNQPGLAQGRFTRRQFERLRRAVAVMLRDADITLSGWCVCPHAPQSDGTPACPCRKPGPAMLLSAAQLHGFDLARSWMIGDILDDVEAGRRAGCRTVLLDVGNETLWRTSPWRVPHHRCSNWSEVADCIVAASRGQELIHPARAARCTDRLALEERSVA